MVTGQSYSTSLSLNFPLCKLGLGTKLSVVCNKVLVNSKIPIKKYRFPQNQNYCNHYHHKKGLSWEPGESANSVG